MQVGFFEVVAMPLFRSLVAVIPGAQPLLDAASDNYFIWRGGGKPSDEGKPRASAESSKAGATATVQLVSPSNGSEIEDATAKAESRGGKHTSFAAQAPLGGSAQSA